MTRALGDTLRFCSSLAVTLGLTLTTAGPVANATDTVKPSAARAAPNAGASNAAMVATEILDRWQEVAQNAGANMGSWRELYGSQLRLMDAANMKRVSALRVRDGVDASSAYAVFTRAFINAQASMYMARGTGNSPVKLGSAASDLVYVPVAPCRVLDTRTGGGGPISAGVTRNFYNYSLASSAPATDFGFQGGDGACPGTNFFGSVAPAAVALTVSVINPTAGGNWIVWSGSDPLPTVSTLNWAPGQVLVNTTIVPTAGRTGAGAGGPLGDFAIEYNGQSGSADTTVDVVGYFIENTRTALDCVSPSTAAPAGAFVNGAHLQLPNPSCTAGYSTLSSGCIYDGVLPAGVYLQETSVAFGYCAWFNGSGATLAASDFQSTAECCRLPGR